MYNIKFFVSLLAKHMLGVNTELRINTLQCCLYSEKKTTIYGFHFLVRNLTNYRCIASWSVCQLYSIYIPMP